MLAFTLITGHLLVWTAPDGIDWARMSLLQISDKCDRRSIFPASWGERRREGCFAQEASAQGNGGSSKRKIGRLSAVEETLRQSDRFDVPLASC